jgi:hypothetical protein
MQRGSLASGHKDEAGGVARPRNEDGGDDLAVYDDPQLATLWGGPGGRSAVPNWVHTVVTVAGSSAAAVGMMLSIAPVNASAMRILFMSSPVSSDIASNSVIHAIQQLKEPLRSEGLKPIDCFKFRL